MTVRISTQLWKRQDTSYHGYKMGQQLATYLITADSGPVVGVGATLPPNTTFDKPSYPSTQPPSHKPPEFRKSQLLRQYASLLRSSSLMLLFQHNNIKANEWLALRRELSLGMRAADNLCAATAKRKAMTAIEDSDSTLYQELAPLIKIQTVQTGIFTAALKVVDYYESDLKDVSMNKQITSSSSQMSNSNRSRSRSPYTFTHTLSKTTHKLATKSDIPHDLSPLLSGPICVLYFPTVSIVHLKQAISILSPSPPDFPAPKKKTSPGWHDPAMQEAVKKLLLLGARIESKTFDIEGIKMIGNIEGGLEGLHGQLLAILQSAGSNFIRTLESASHNLYYTLNAREIQLDDSMNSDSKPRKGEK